MRHYVFSNIAFNNLFCGGFYVYLLFADDHALTDNYIEIYFLIIFIIYIYAFNYLCHVLRFIEFNRVYFSRLKKYIKYNIFIDYISWKPLTELIVNVKSSVSARILISFRKQLIEWQDRCLAWFQIRISLLFTNNEQTYLSKHIELFRDISLKKISKNKNSSKYEFKRTQLNISGCFIGAISDDNNDVEVYDNSMDAKIL